MAQPEDPAELRALEAARYALLRRLALSMRHHMVVHLQPMGMIADLLERRLVAPQPDIAQVRECVDRIHRLSRQAVDSCMDVVSWLAPPPGATVPLREGVQECVDLLRSSLSFRGIALVNQLGDLPQPVGRAGLRYALTGSLLALTEQGPSPAELRITASLQPGATTLALHLHPGVGEPVVPGAEPPRPLGWEQVERLARAEDIALSHTPMSAQLVLPLA